MERKVWQTFATATALYFASAAPATRRSSLCRHRQRTIAATINDLASTAVAVPEAPPAPAVEVPAVTRHDGAGTPLQKRPRHKRKHRKPTESQYQEPEPQYHPSTTDGSGAPEVAVRALRT